MNTNVPYQVTKTTKNTEDDGPKTTAEMETSLDEPHIEDESGIDHPNAGPSGQRSRTLTEKGLEERKRMLKNKQTSALGAVTSETMSKTGSTVLSDA